MTYFVFGQKWVTFFFLQPELSVPQSLSGLREQTSFSARNPLSAESVMVQASLPCQQRTGPKDMHDKGLNSGHFENTCRRYTDTHVYTHICIFLQEGCLITSSPAKTDLTTVFGSQHSDFNLEWHGRYLRIQSLLFPQRKVLYFSFTSQDITSDDW